MLRTAIHHTQKALDFEAGGGTAPRELRSSLERRDDGLGSSRHRIGDWVLLVCRAERARGVRKKAGRPGRVIT